jgi:hypothetical protein
MPSRADPGDIDQPSDDMVAERVAASASAEDSLPGARDDCGVQPPAATRGFRP